MTLRVTPQISEGDSRPARRSSRRSPTSTRARGRHRRRRTTVGARALEPQGREHRLRARRRDGHDRRPDQRQYRRHREQGALARRHPDPRLGLQEHRQTLQQDNLLVFLTPRIVRDAAGPRAASRSASARSSRVLVGLRARSSDEEGGRRVARRSRPAIPLPSGSATPCAASSTATTSSTRSSAARDRAPGGGRRERAPRGRVEALKKPEQRSYLVQVAHFATAEDAREPAARS